MFSAELAAKEHNQANIKPTPIIIPYSSHFVKLKDWTISILRQNITVLAPMLKSDMKPASTNIALLITSIFIGVFFIFCLIFFFHTSLMAPSEVGYVSCIGCILAFHFLVCFC